MKRCVSACRAKARFWPAPESPLLYALDKGKLRVLFIGFDLMASDLPLRVAFPIFFTMRSNGFSLSALEFPGHNRSQAGTPIALRLPAGDGNLEVSYPTANERI